MTGILLVDAPRFAIPRVMKHNLNTRNRWVEFKNRCGIGTRFSFYACQLYLSIALLVLRRHFGFVLQMSRYYFGNLVGDDEIQKCISSALFMG